MMYLPATGLETDAASIAGQKPELRASWLPMIVIAMAQILMSFNINALRVSVGGIVASFNTSPTTVGTAIVIHSLVVAGLVMLGAKIAALFGARSVFQATVVLFGGALTIMALSPNTTMMIMAQAVAGGAAAALIPTLVVLIAANYRGRQQAHSPRLAGRVGGHGWRGGISGRGLPRLVDRLALPVRACSPSSPPASSSSASDWTRSKAGATGGSIGSASAWWLSPSH